MYGPSEVTCTVAAPLGAHQTLALAGDGDESDNYDTISYWGKRNVIDVAVTVPPVRGSVGQTVDLTFRVTDLGPSDGGGPGVLIVAPSGTVLLPAQWCWTDGTPHQQLPESTRVRCNFESYFPTVHSGHGRVGQTIGLRIKSTPGRDGSITASGEIAEGTEYRPRNNTARIVGTA